MAFCSNCGAQAAGGFCPNCGTPMAGAAGGAAEATANPVNAQAGLTTSAASALCYLFGFITGIIFLVLSPYNQNKTVRFHAFQSIFLGVAIVAISILLSILTAITGFAFFLFPIFWLACVIIWLYMLFSTYSGKNVNLPVIGDLAQKQA